MKRLLSIFVFSVFLATPRSNTMELPSTENSGKQEVSDLDEVSMEPVCGLAYDLSDKVHANLPVRGALENSLFIKEWPTDLTKLLEKDHSFVLKNESTGDFQKELKKFYRERIRGYRIPLEEMVRCATKKRNEIEIEQEELANNPLKTQGRYIIPGMAQTIVGVSFLALFIYDVSNVINGLGSTPLNREALFNRQTAHDGAMKASAWATLLGASFWGLKKGFSNIKKGLNLASELDQEKTNAGDNIDCCNVLVKFAHDMRKANPNLKTPKNPRQKKVTVNEKKNTVN